MNLFFIFFLFISRSTKNRDEEYTFSEPNLFDDEELAVSETSTDLLVPRMGLTAWYRMSGYKNGVWKSSVGGFKMKVLKGSERPKYVRKKGNGAGEKLGALTGSSKSVITFGRILPQRYTICSLTRYYGDKRGRILTGSRVGPLKGKGNWLHGHWAGRIGVARYQDWGTYRFSIKNLNRDNWLVMCGQSLEAGNLIRANGHNVRAQRPGDGPWWVNINTGSKEDESDWAVSEILTWNRHLTRNEMRRAEKYLLKKLRGKIEDVGDSVETEVRDVEPEIERMVGDYWSSSIFDWNDFERRRLSLHQAAISQTKEEQDDAKKQALQEEKKKQEAKLKKEEEEEAKMKEEGRAHLKKQKKGESNGERKPVHGLAGRLPRRGMVAWYRYNDYNYKKKTWKSAVSGHRMRVFEGRDQLDAHELHGHSEATEFGAVTGTTKTAVSFGKIIKQDYTVCSITRYHGETKRRILTGSNGKAPDSTDGNWFHGHWEGRIGLAHYEGWYTSYNREFAALKDPMQWVLMCGQNSVGPQFRSQGLSVRRDRRGDGPYFLNVNMGGIPALRAMQKRKNKNKPEAQKTEEEKTIDQRGSETSDWAVAEIITWNYRLTMTEIKAVEAYFQHIIKTGNFDTPKVPHHIKSKRKAAMQDEEARKANWHGAKKRGAGSDGIDKATDEKGVLNFEVPAKAHAKPEAAVSDGDEDDDEDDGDGEDVGTYDDPYNNQIYMAEDAVGEDFSSALAALDRPEHYSAGLSSDLNDLDDELVAALRDGDSEMGVLRRPETATGDDDAAPGPAAYMDDVDEDEAFGEFDHYLTGPKVNTGEDAELDLGTYDDPYNNQNYMAETALGEYGEDEAEFLESEREFYRRNLKHRDFEDVFDQFNAYYSPEYAVGAFDAADSEDLDGFMHELDDLLGGAYGDTESEVGEDFDFDVDSADDDIDTGETFDFDDPSLDDEDAKEDKLAGDAPETPRVDDVSPALDQTDKDAMTADFDTMDDLDGDVEKQGKHQKVAKKSSNTKAVGGKKDTQQSKGEGIVGHHPKNKPYDSDVVTVRNKLTKDDNDHVARSDAKRSSVHERDLSNEKSEAKEGSKLKRVDIFKTSLDKVENSLEELSHLGAEQHKPEARGSESPAEKEFEADLAKIEKFTAASGAARKRLAPHFKSKSEKDFAEVQLNTYNAVGGDDFKDKAEPISESAVGGGGLPDGMVAWYQFANFRDGKWKSSIGTHEMKIVEGEVEKLMSKGFGARSTVGALSGSWTAKVTFGPIIEEYFTICSLSRYTGQYRNRILQGSYAEDDTKGNWVHGHWADRVGVAYYGKWLTDKENKLKKRDNWLLMCGQNDQHPIMHANGIDVGSSRICSRKYNLNINTGGCPTCAKEGSEWAVAEIITWGRHLSQPEIEKTERYLKRVLAEGVDFQTQSAKHNDRVDLTTFRGQSVLDKNLVTWLGKPFDVDEEKRQQDQLTRKDLFVRQKQDGKTTEKTKPKEVKTKPTEKKETVQMDKAKLEELKAEAKKEVLAELEKKKKEEESAKEKAAKEKAKEKADKEKDEEKADDLKADKEAEKETKKEEKKENTKKEETEEKNTKGDEEANKDDKVKDEEADKDAKEKKEKDNSPDDKDADKAVTKEEGKEKDTKPKESSEKATEKDESTDDGDGDAANGDKESEKAKKTTNDEGEKPGTANADDKAKKEDVIKDEPFEKDEAKDKDANDKDEAKDKDANDKDEAKDKDAKDETKDAKDGDDGKEAAKDKADDKDKQESVSDKLDDDDEVGNDIDDKINDGIDDLTNWNTDMDYDEFEVASELSEFSLSSYRLSVGFSVFLFCLSAFSFFVYHVYHNSRFQKGDELQVVLLDSHESDFLNGLEDF